MILLLILIAMVLLFGASAVLNFFNGIVKAVLLLACVALGVVVFKTYAMAVLVLAGVACLAILVALIYDSASQETKDARQAKKDAKLAQRLGVELDENGEYQIKPNSN